MFFLKAKSSTFINHKMTLCSPITTIANINTIRQGVIEDVSTSNFKVLKNSKKFKIQFENFFDNSCSSKLKIQLSLKIKQNNLFNKLLVLPLNCIYYHQYASYSTNSPTLQQITSHRPFQSTSLTHGLAAFKEIDVVSSKPSRPQFKIPVPLNASGIKTIPNIRQMLVNHAQDTYKEIG